MKRTKQCFSPTSEAWHGILLLIISLTAVYSNAASAEQSANLFSITPYAAVPAAPGFPEGVVVHGNRIFVSGPARFGTAGTGPSAIHVYDRNTAEWVQSIEVTGEDLSQEHALSNVAVDADGRIYALSTQLGLIRFQKQGHEYVQQSYGDPLPDLPCTDQTNAVCPPPGVVIPPIPNDLVFDAEGNAYVTDSLQQTIFRYAPGGGAPSVWFQSPQFEGSGFFPFGLNGIRLDPMRQYLYFAVSTTANPTVGKIYRLPLVESPNSSDLEQFHTYASSELPDQLAFGASGKLYVSLALSNQISVLNEDGTESMRISSLPGDAIALDNPAGIAFDSASKSLLIVNHALLSGNPAHFAVLKLYAGDPGNPLEKPFLP